MQSKSHFCHTDTQATDNGTQAFTMLIVLLISITLVLSSCTSSGSQGTLNSSGTPTSTTTTHASTPDVSTSSTVVTPPATKLPPLIALHMIDASTGWAFTQPNLYTTGGYILRTTDGGWHWNNVSPSYSTAQQYDDGEITDFLTASIAWMVTARYRVFHTTDGGKTWQRSQIVPPIKGSKATYMTFINSQDGWLVFTSSVNNGEAITVFRTSDGGNNWTAISSTGTSANQLPAGAYDWTLGFLNTSTGWAGGGYSPLSASTHVYMTNDGGISWYQQALPPPTGETYARFQVLAPTFFTANDGLLPVLYYVNGNDEGLALYVTHNSGMSWSSTTPLSTSIPQSSGAAQTLAGLSSVNMNDIQVIGNNGLSLYITNDAGQHWIAVAPPTQNAIHAISFVSNLTGWAIVKPDFDTSSLYKTTDGGKTWIEVFHTSLAQ